MLKTLVTLLALAAFQLQAHAREAIQVMGSSTLLPLVSEAAKQFSKYHPDTQIMVSGGGSGVGIASIIRGSADLGMASRDPDPKEAELLAGRANFISIARDAVAIAVSKAVYLQGVTALSLPQIAAIYRGQIQNWKDLGGADARILVIDKEIARGTRQVFAQRVLGSTKARAPGAMVVAGSNNEEQALIARSDQAIGILSSAWLNDRVRALAIQGKDGIVTPTTENIRLGRYPVSRDLYLLVPKEANTVTKDFVKFLQSPPGQAIVENMGYLPVH